MKYHSYTPRLHQPIMYNHLTFSAHLATWFKSLRDMFTELDNGKSGNGDVLTEREGSELKTCFPSTAPHMREVPLLVETVSNLTPYIGCGGGRL